eukprot:42439-Eustigmatos_ZCMA.PRE.1
MHIHPPRLAPSCTSGVQWPCGTTSASYAWTDRADGTSGGTRTRGRDPGSSAQPVVWWRGRGD